MSERLSAEYFIRPLRRSDRRAMRDICVATAWMGDPGAGHVPDGWIWAEFWTRYFTDREPQNSFALCDSGKECVAGYLMGTSDARRFDRYIPFLIPGIILRTIRKRLISRCQTRAGILAMLKSIVSGQMDIPPALVRQYPATMHIDMLPEARGQRYGVKLYELFVNKMLSLGVAGIHAQTLSVNKPITRFCQTAGFTLVASKPIEAFSHVEPDPIEILTWTKSLR
ncbi:MAG: GNAT family N-acetyltransferase [bacterium]|nr:GNAT family N-acetyltransferase [bacterium]